MEFALMAACGMGYVLMCLGAITVSSRMAKEEFWRVASEKDLEFRAACGIQPDGTILLSESAKAK